MAADPLARADPLGDLVEVGGEKPLHVALVVQSLVEVVGPPRVGGLGRGDDLLHPAPLAEALQHSQRVRESGSLPRRAAGW